MPSSGNGQVADRLAEENLVADGAAFAIGRMSFGSWCWCTTPSTAEVTTCDFDSAMLLLDADLLRVLRRWNLVRHRRSPVVTPPQTAAVEPVAKSHPCASRPGPGSGRSASIDPGQDVAGPLASITSLPSRAAIDRLSPMATNLSVRDRDAALHGVLGRDHPAVLHDQIRLHECFSIAARCVLRCLRGRHSRPDSVR